MNSPQFNHRTLLKIFKTVLNYRLLYNVLAYVDSQTLLQIIKATNRKSVVNDFLNTTCKLQAHPQQCQIIKTIKTYYFINEHLNKTDRTMYFSFYQEPQFHQIQTELSQKLTTNQYNSFCCFYDQFQNIFSTLQQHCQFAATQFEELRRIFIDPSLPLPKLKRQNQGMFCKSNFQLFLVGLRKKKHNEQLSLFQQLKQSFSQNQQTFLKIFIQILKQKHSQLNNLKKIQEVRYTPYQISHVNYRNYLLSSSFFIHNFIVCLFALTQLLIQSIYQYIQVLDDPFLKFVQLMTRYGVFRSFVIQIEENLSFVFQEYDCLYSDVTRESINNKTKFNFWRPAMTKWYLKMKQLHESSNLIFSFLLIRMRFENIQKFIQESSIFKQHLIPIKNNLSSITFEGQLHERICAQQVSCVQEFLNKNQDLYQILTVEYVQYMVDLSINQQTVHWCDHSDHQLQIPYNYFQKNFLQCTMQYFKNLEKSIVGKTNKQSLQFLNVVFQEQVNFLQIKGLKPLTIKKLINIVNQEYKLAQAENELTPIFCDFTFKDQNLKYFNSKAKIDYAVNEQQKCFFSISPLLSPEEILVKSIDTNDSDRISNSNSQYQYISDNDESEYFQDQHSPDRNKSFTQGFLLQNGDIFQNNQTKNTKPSLIKIAILQKQPQFCSNDSYIQGCEYQRKTRSQEGKAVNNQKQQQLNSKNQSQSLPSNWNTINIKQQIDTIDINSQKETKTKQS